MVSAEAVSWAGEAVISVIGFYMGCYREMITEHEKKAKSQFVALKVVEYAPTISWLTRLIIMGPGTLLQMV